MLLLVAILSLRLALCVTGTTQAVSTSNQTAKAAAAHQLYLEQLLHVYGHDGTIDLQGLSNLLTDIHLTADKQSHSENQHQPLLHHQHAEDAHVDHDHSERPHHPSAGMHAMQDSHGNHDHRTHDSHEHDDHEHHGHEQQEDNTDRRPKLHFIIDEDIDHSAALDQTEEWSSGQYEDHDHGDHDHENHGHGDHGHAAHGHADHDHQRRGPDDHERGLAPRDGAADSETPSSEPHDQLDDVEAEGLISTADKMPVYRARRTRALKPTDSAAIAEHGNSQCRSLPALLSEFALPAESRLNAAALDQLCPALLYHVSAGRCPQPPSSTDLHDGHHHGHDGDASRAPIKPTDQWKLWLFSGLAVVCISLCGLAGVAVVPIMQRVVYRQLLQFLVALAVGTLAGDALLHLLPHALTPHRAHDQHADHADHGDDHGAGELDAVLKGMVALVSLLFFFVAERAIGILHATCTSKRTQKIKKRLASMRHLDRETTEMIGRRISSYRHSAGASHCFADSDTRDVLAHLKGPNDTHGSCDEHEDEPTGQETLSTQADEAERDALASKDLLSPPSVIINSAGKPAHSHANNHNHAAKTAETEAGARDAAEGVARDSCERFSANERVEHSGDFTVIIHEHEHRHHGHTHTHGHIHQPPGSAAAVAGMVIVGDGLHNFTDGMAIGAAFAAGLASGLSTSVAVFCHELPHEIGDFAVLLQSGMSVRQALFYNVLSSVLCLFGMVLGMLLGNLEAFSGWVFAAAAGSFIYIALVDMVPELTSSGAAPEGTSPCGLLTVQVLGMCCGAGIMLTIAIYEHDLHSLVTVL